MRKTLCLFLIVIFIPHLTACQSDKLLQTDSPHLLLTACVYYSVPGFYQSDLKGVQVLLKWMIMDEHWFVLKDIII